MIDTLLGLFRPRGRHAAGRHAAPKAKRHVAPKPPRRRRELVDAYDETTMALFDMWNRPAAYIVNQLVGSTLALTHSIDAALRMTDLIRRQAGAL